MSSSLCPLGCRGVGVDQSFNETDHISCGFDVWAVAHSVQHDDLHSILSSTEAFPHLLCHGDGDDSIVPPMRDQDFSLSESARSGRELSVFDLEANGARGL